MACLRVIFKTQPKLKYRKGKSLDDILVKANLNFKAEELKSLANNRSHATDVPSSRLEKKQKINSWKRHGLYDAVLRYARNRWEFERVVRNSSGKKIRSIYNAKYSKIWTFHT